MFTFGIALLIAGGLVIVMEIQSLTIYLIAVPSPVSSQVVKVKQLTHCITRTKVEPEMKFELTKEPVTSVASVTAVPEPLGSSTWCYASRSIGTLLRQLVK